MNKLEQAARQALGALVRAEAMYGQPNADIQTALREALAEPELNLNCKSVQKRLATVWGYVKAEQAEQEPVAWVDAKEEGYEFYGISYLPVGKHHLYAAPVRTKDLTNDEILPDGYSVVTSYDGLLEFARAVIAADRRKNKC